MSIMSTAAAIPLLKLTPKILEQAAAALDESAGGPAFALESHDERGQRCIAIVKVPTERVRRRLAYVYDDFDGGAFIDELTAAGDHWVNSLGESFTKRRLVVLGEVEIVIGGNQ